MDWSVDSLARANVTKLLYSTVVPRPIALVTTLNADESVNTAPFSFFNVLCTSPALLVLGIDGNDHAADQLKDTTRNVAARGELVVSLVEESLVHQMNICGIEFPAHIDEAAMAGLQLLPSVQVAPPRVAASPVNFECRLRNLIPVDSGRSIIICEIIHIHVRDGLVNESFHVDMDKLHMIGRMHGNGWYARTSDRFQVLRIPLEKWQSSASDTTV